MPKHLGSIDEQEFRTIESGIVNWLKKHDVSAGFEPDYDLFAALRREYKQARKAWDRRENKGNR